MQVTNCWAGPVLARELRYPGGLTDLPPVGEREVNGCGQPATDRVTPGANEFLL